MRAFDRWYILCLQIRNSIIFAKKHPMHIWSKLLFLGLIVSVYACETKVDLVSEGEETPVVFGFIDPTLDTQFVKITKSFVTEGSAYDGALDPSLSEYESLEVWIVEYDENDSINSYLLQEKVVTDKDSGVFYYPVQTVYYTDEIIFEEDDDPKYEHDFEIRFNGSGKNVRSKIPVVGAFKPNNSQAFENISFVLIFDPSGSSYQDKAMIINPSENVKRYEFKLRYYYREVYLDGSEKEKFMDFKYSPWIVPNSSSQPKNIPLSGENFFSGIASRLQTQDNEANISKRVIGELHYIFDYAGDDFNTFIELSEPETSFNSEQNPYTNIENGIGVWGSRGQTIFTGKKLDFSSIEEMVLGQYTIDYLFCSDDPGHTGLDVGCQ